MGHDMTIERLDFIFPFIVLAYGLLITFVHSLPACQSWALQKLPSELYERFQKTRLLGLICLGVGSVWSLQNWLFGMP